MEVVKSVKVDCYQTEQQTCKFLLMNNIFS